MTGGFQAAVIRNTAQVFFGQGHFEEIVAYRVNEASSPVNVAILETHGDGGIVEDGHHLSDARKMTVFVARSPVVVLQNGSRSDWETVMTQNLHSAPYNARNPYKQSSPQFSPALGNMFDRTDGSRWGFVRVQAEDFASFTLVFERHQILRSGTKPMGL